MKTSLLRGILIIVTVLVLAGCSNGDVGDNSPDTLNLPDTSEWLHTNLKHYLVTDGVVERIPTETNTTWISYVDNKHFEHSDSTIGYREYTKYDDAYNIQYSRVESGQGLTNVLRNGNTLRIISHLITDVTETHDYPSTQRSIISRITLDSTNTIVYDEKSGLYLSQTSDSTESHTVDSTSNVNEGSTSFSIDYIIELLTTTADGVSTYKSTPIINGETSTSYSEYEYKIKNGLTLEVKGYSSGVLVLTTTFIYPENGIIKSKLPCHFIRVEIIGPKPLYITYITFSEVVSDSSTELVIREKIYNSNTGILTGQIEYTYKPRNILIR
jgi:hypothetical protein